MSCNVTLFATLVIAIAFYLHRELDFGLLLLDVFDENEQPENVHGEREDQ